MSPSHVDYFKDATRRLLELEKEYEQFEEKGLLNEEITDTFRIASDFSELDLERVEDQDMIRLVSHIRDANRIVEEMIRYKAGGRLETRDVESFRTSYKTVMGIYRAEVPWLTVFCGPHKQLLVDLREGQTVARSSLLDIVASRERANELAKTTQASAESAKVAVEEAKGVLEEARTTALKETAKAFTKGFARNAEQNGKSARTWAWITGTAFGLTLLVTAGMLAWFHFAPPIFQDMGTAGMLLYAAWRVGTVGVLAAATLWCGRQYRAYLHGKQIDLHRAVCLENLAAFRSSVDDPKLKDVVTMEFSKAAAQAVPTGFLSSRVESRGDSIPTTQLSLRANPSASGGSS